MKRVSVSQECVQGMELFIYTNGRHFKARITEVVPLDEGALYRRVQCAPVHNCKLRHLLPGLTTLLVRKSSVHGLWVSHINGNLNALKLELDTWIQQRSERLRDD